MVFTLFFSFTARGFRYAFPKKDKSYFVFDEMMLSTISIL